MKIAYYLYEGPTTLTEADYESGEFEGVYNIYKDGVIIGSFEGLEECEAFLKTLNN